MNNELIEELSRNKAEQTATKRILDTYYKDEKKRTKLFNKINYLKKQEEKIKFRIRLERQIKKNEKSREKF